LTLPLIDLRDLAGANVLKNQMQTGQILISLTFFSTLKNSGAIEDGEDGTVEIADENSHGERSNLKYAS